ncbi:hypothetical protein N0V91_002661 [Didymella pomorum]|uniref:Uncharacterized protein n=1 Tax=Didymella pomorum TaxID=749634 RepID=A0A9W8ZJT2_9PLEO|nr:hypothetical protein N0V91_002661 [Didymella pomorum]
MRGSIIATLVMAVMIPTVTAGGGRKKTPCDSCTDVYNTASATLAVRAATAQDACNYWKQEW